MSATKLGDRSEFDQSLVELSETSRTPSQDDNQAKDQGNKSEDFGVCISERNGKTNC